MQNSIEGLSAVSGLSGNSMSFKAEAFNNNTVLSPNVAGVSLEVHLSPVVNLFSRALLNSPTQNSYSMPPVTSYSTVQFFNWLSEITSKTKEQLKEWIPSQIGLLKTFEAILLYFINQYKTSPSLNAYNQVAKVAALVMEFYNYSKDEDGQNKSQDRINEQLLYEVKQEELFKKPFPLIVFFTNKTLLNHFNQKLNTCDFDWNFYHQNVISNESISREDYRLNHNNEWRKEINLFITRLEKIIYKNDSTEDAKKLVLHFLKLEGRLLWLEMKYQKSTFPYIKSNTVRSIKKKLRKSEYKDTLQLKENFGFLLESPFINAKDRKEKLDKIVQDLRTRHFIRY